jgi:hypothetical protein
MLPVDKITKGSLENDVASAMSVYKAISLNLYLSQSFAHKCCDCNEEPYWVSGVDHSALDSLRLARSSPALLKSAAVLEYG